MVDTVKVVYGFSFGNVSFDKLFKRVACVATSYRVDFDLQIKTNAAVINVYSFKYRNAKAISEKEGGVIMSSLINLCEDCIKDGNLISVDMCSSLPF